MTVKEILDIPIEHLRLSPVARCQCIIKGYNTLEDILNIPYAKLEDRCAYSIDVAYEIWLLRMCIIARIDDIAEGNFDAKLISV